MGFDTGATKFACESEGVPPSRGHPSRPIHPKKRSISSAAVSGASEACTMLYGSSNAKSPAYRARQRLGRVGGSDDVANDLDCIGAFQNGHDHRTGGNRLD